MTASAAPAVGVVLIAHGAGAGWNARVDSLAATVRQGPLKAPVAVAYLMGPAAATHRFQDAVAELRKQGAQRIVVVPLLVSSHSGHYEQIRYLARQVDTLDAEMMHHLQMSGLERVSPDIPMTVTPALDDAPELARVVTDRARAIVPNPAGHALFLYGHGPNSAENYAEWMVALRRVCDSVRAATGFASVTVELVRDDAPPEVRAEAVRRMRELVELQHAATGQTVAVVPLLVSSGDVSNRKAPHDLADLPVEYTGVPLLPHPALADWVASRVRTALTQPERVAVPAAANSSSASAPSHMQHER
jgi:sirohydrochlorin ferrochelatase